MTTTIQYEFGTSNPRIVRIVTTATLTQVTTAGWYNNSPIAGEQLLPTDTVLITYAYQTSSQANAFFSVSIASGIVTLSIAEANVVLPTISGQLASFSNTSGTIQDSGLLVSNAMSKATSNTMAAGAYIITDKSTATTTGGAATINKQSGVLTTPSLTTAAGSSYVITLTNSQITASSVILTSFMGGSSTQTNITITAVPGSGSATITIYNENSVSALNGTIIIGFVVC